MKNAKEKTKKQALNLYIDAETYEALAEKSTEWEMSISQIVIGLVRSLCGRPLDLIHQKVESALKIKYGRDQFLAFIRSVQEILPASAKPLIKEDAKEDFIPDTWVMGDTVILAFFNPNSENIGQVFSQATTLKAQYKAPKVLVVSPLADITPPVARESLALANINVVGICGLAEEIKKNT